MSKEDKKRAKLESRLVELESFLTTSLGKKDSTKVEVDIPKLMREITDLKAKIKGM